jgi:pimeloyl-ACP methyl ester carboxylesterase
MGSRGWPKPSGAEPYGYHADQFAERFGDGPRVAALLHGGFWRAKYDCSLEHGVARDLAERGWTVWNVEYRRGHGWDAMSADVRAALAKHAPEVVIGHSAGGHLALWALAEGLVPAAVSQAGVNDLALCDELNLSDGAVRELFGGPPPAVADPARRRPLPGRALCVTGDRDDSVPVRMSTVFEGDPGVDVVVIEGEDHYVHLDASSRCWAAVVDWLGAREASAAHG